MDGGSHNEGQTEQRHVNTGRDGVHSGSSAGWQPRAPTCNTHCVAGLAKQLQVLVTLGVGLPHLAVDSLPAVGSRGDVREGG